MAKPKQSRGKAGIRSPHDLVRAAGSLPVHEVLMTRDWRDQRTIIQIVVSRREPGGPFVGGLFLVDLGCLGVKNAMVFVLEEERYESLRSRLLDSQPLAPVDLALAVKVIREGIAYARSLGFEPHPDCLRARWVLDGADADGCAEPVPLGGRDGKPFFIAGPDDDADGIIRRLARRLGADGFHFIAPLRIVG